MLDLKVRVLYGKENEKENTILTQYVKFTQIYRKNVAIYGKTREAVIVTLKECKEQGILVDYIIEHEVEVIDVMMALYDRETYMELYDAQKERESNFKLLASLVKDGLLSISEAAKRSNLSETEFRNKAALPVV